MFTAMKLSTFIPLLGAFTIATLNTSCLESRGAAEKSPEQTPENGAQFKKGQGLSLTQEMSKAIGLKVEDVGETKVAPVISLNVSAVTQNTATGWVTRLRDAHGQGQFLRLAVPRHRRGSSVVCGDDLVG